MDKLLLREVTQENWRETLKLTVHPEQQRFVADYAPIAAIALAKAYIRPGGLVWTPYAFCTVTDIVGFSALAYEPESIENYWIRHFFIDQRYQNRGYGKQALRLLLEFVKEHHTQCQTLQLTVHPENYNAQRLYKRLGFQLTGVKIDEEPVYKLMLKL